MELVSERVSCHDISVPLFGEEARTANGPTTTTNPLHVSASDPGTFVFGQGLPQPGKLGDPLAAALYRTLVPTVGHPSFDIPLFGWP